MTKINETKLIEIGLKARFSTCNVPKWWEITFWKVTAVISSILKSLLSLFMLFIFFSFWSILFIKLWNPQMVKINIAKFWVMQARREVY